MLQRLGARIAEDFKKWMPDAFVFALLLTVIVSIMAMLWTDTSVIQLTEAWYNGLGGLLKFAMQVVLILVTGFAIALSPITGKLIDKLAGWVSSPAMVYVFCITLTCLCTLVTYGLLPVMAVLARELAKRVKGIDYPFLVGCIYISFVPFVCGLSSSIPLLLNTEGNFLIEAGLLNSTISIESTLFSPLNIVMTSFYLLGIPFIMWVMRPKPDQVVEMSTLKSGEEIDEKITVEEEANSFEMTPRSFSDKLNGSSILQLIVVAMGIILIVWKFIQVGSDAINLNMIIFIFLILGMLLHGTPMRYVLAMKRACSNISGIVFQYPFYAGIMGIMMDTGLGKTIAEWMAGFVTFETLPIASFFLGGIVNFAIPSAGGEWAVLGSPLVELAQNLGSGLSPEAYKEYVAFMAMSVAYGESLTNMVQPFFLLIVLPVMGAGINIQARDVMGYVLLPFIFLFTVSAGLVLFFSFYM
ncbi:MAG: short-chain fatty acid transporter [Bacteroidetes bacterium]|nr:short-chain fatty acid transporter [Bacteroidota bacterium]